MLRVSTSHALLTVLVLCSAFKCRCIYTLKQCKSSCNYTSNLLIEESLTNYQNSVVLPFISVLATALYSLLYFSWSKIKVRVEYSHDLYEMMRGSEFKKWIKCPKSPCWSGRSWNEGAQGFHLYSSMGRFGLLPFILAQDSTIDLSQAWECEREKPYSLLIKWLPVLFPRLFRSEPESKRDGWPIRMKY